jgi:DNA-binding NarL/FixJ family response regulator
MSKLDGIEHHVRFYNQCRKLKFSRLRRIDPGTRCGRHWKAGARGFLLKAEVPTELVKAVTTVAQGGFFLTPGRSQAVAQEFQNDTKQR